MLQIRRCPRTNRSPSTSGRQPIPAASAGRPPRCRIAASARITATNDTALTAYTTPSPNVDPASAPVAPTAPPPPPCAPNAATRIPASAGPTIVPICQFSVLRLTALARCSRGTRCGMSDCCAGLLNAAAAAVAALNR